MKTIFLGEVTSTQPRPLPQHLGQIQKVEVITHTMKCQAAAWHQNKFENLIREKCVCYEECELVCTSILLSDSWMVSCSKLWSRLSKVLLSSTSDSSLQTHPKWFMHITHDTDTFIRKWICELWKVQWCRLQGKLDNSEECVKANKM